MVHVGDDSPRCRFQNVIKSALLSPLLRHGERSVPSRLLMYSNNEKQLNLERGTSCELQRPVRTFSKLCWNPNPNPRIIRIFEAGIVLCGILGSRLILRLTSCIQSIREFLLKIDLHSNFLRGSQWPERDDSTPYRPTEGRGSARQPSGVQFRRSEEEGLVSSERMYDSERRNTLCILIKPLSGTTQKGRTLEHSDEIILTKRKRNPGLNR